jgi:MFS family permease
MRARRALIGVMLTGNVSTKRLHVGPVLPRFRDFADVDRHHGQGYAGSASALMNAAGACAGILSPLMFGWIPDQTGSWTTPFAVSLGCCCSVSS